MVGGGAVSCWRCIAGPRIELQHPVSQLTSGPCYLRKEHLKIVILSPLPPSCEQAHDRWMKLAQWLSTGLSQGQNLDELENTQFKEDFETRVLPARSSKAFGTFYFLPAKPSALCGIMLSITAKVTTVFVFCGLFQLAVRGSGASGVKDRQSSSWNTNNSRSPLHLLFFPRKAFFSLSEG